MQTITIKDLFAGADPDGQIYVLRDGKCVLYAGKASSGIAYRWLDNFGGRFQRRRDGWYPRDPIAEFVARHTPHSYGWQLDCYSKDETLAKFLDDYRRYYLKRNGFEYPAAVDRIDLNEAEKICITALRPCLNTSCNPDPTPLPAKYRMQYDRRNKQVERDAVEQIVIPD